VVGFARTAKTGEQFREEMRAAVGEFGRRGRPDEEVWTRFAPRLHYLSGDYDDPAAHSRLDELLSGLGTDCGATERVYYLALPPAAAETVLRRMRDRTFSPPGAPGGRGRLMIEKPFGLDLAGARRLDRLCTGLFPEESIYRIDHYLAKDTVRNLMVLRFANSIFEHLWNRKYVDNVQITAAETIGVEGRGGYYEQSGVVRDMLQNHLLQVMALVAMEPPVAGDAESLRDRTAEVLRSLAPVAPGDFVFGQYNGYRRDRGVDPASRTPTFAALRLGVRNWRWEGVPFYLRSGKCLAEKSTEVVIVFKGVPACVLDSPDACAALRPNRLTVRIQPDEGMRLSFCTRVPGRGEQVREANLDFRYAQVGGEMSEAYEQVLLEGLGGRSSWFWRADGVEAAWRAVGPLLDAGGAGELHGYEPGSWGPDAAAALLAGDGRAWQEPY
jgi:glucose-6-phosphate 1-dehydrogenase